VAWDNEVRERFPAPKPSALTTFFQVVTWAGNAFVLAGLVVAAAVWFMQRRRPERAALIVAGAFAAEATALTLKVTLHDLHPNSYAFPSGHTAGATATYGILFYLTVRRRSVALRGVAGIALVSLISVVAMSRLYLHVHYLSDVLAGSTLGVAVAAACLFLYEWRERRASNRQGTATI
jgi:undecaprenyl-diphosphatase